MVGVRELKATGEARRGMLSEMYILDFVEDIRRCAGGISDKCRMRLREKGKASECEIEMFSCYSIFAEHHNIWIHHRAGR